MGDLLKNRKVLITGAYRGNGKGIADGMLEESAEITVFDIHVGDNPNMTYYEVDLRDKTLLAKTFEEASSKQGPFDVLVNDAGITIGMPAEEYTMDAWNATLDVNLTVPFVLSQMFARKLIEDKRPGSIINITSLSGKYGFPNNPGYCAAKGGLRILSKQLALDWAKYDIRVNNVSPGYMHTNMTNTSYNDPKMNAERTNRMMFDRWGEPEDLAGACIFLASNMSSYITGQDIIVDGGWDAKGL